MTRKIYIFIVSFLVGYALFIPGASGVEANPSELANTMRMWHVADGLPSDSVTAIVQTRDGFLWIGTTAGLVHFDGMKFTLVKSTDFSTHNSCAITALCEDSNGYLWIGTQANGLFRLSGGKILHYGKERGLLFENVSSLAADEHGHVWIGSSTGLARWADGRFELFGKRDGLPDESVSGVDVARSGTVWITTREGMCRFVDGPNGSL